MEIWDFLTSINETKKDIWKTCSDEEKKIYNHFIINKALSFFPDTIIYSNEMNRLYNLDKDMQYQFYLNTIRKGKRYSKWFKKLENEDLKTVKQYYQCNDKKAVTILQILDKEQLEYLKKQIKIINGVKNG